MSNIFIYGSCVSRDAYGFHLQHHKSLHYIARQSWISATAPPSSVTINEELASDFQNRMIQGDISSNLLPTLQENNYEIDLLLMDWIDERLGVFELQDGGFITRSFELLNTKPQEIIETSRHIKFGTDELFDLWKTAAMRFKENLDSLKLTHKSLIIVTPYATLNNIGNPPPPESQYTPEVIAKANQTFTHMADYAESIGLTVARMPQELAVADSNHKWGETPFHYCDDAMKWIAQEVEHALLRSQP